ncbi:hypothetical protein [Criblamydia sequanensis]|uniref:Uncharacterized protein n=1 Tax=Candidatus Criblamydia sequanensis CRIB-18 TaxID=1437425 RepID=A0A090CYJ1_9BACT|nr:hypothetical protein [Criblamydia sequanensis]CDR33642.1 hypothetical protein CSEC_0813 [Criblamydia sequanensis CRIB-18]
MSSVIGSNKVVVPYKDLERQINDLNENNAYVTRAEPVDIHEEKSEWKIYWRTSSFIETRKDEAEESQNFQPLTDRNFSLINESKEEYFDLGEGKSPRSIKNSNKISYFVRQIFKRVYT